MLAWRVLIHTLVPVLLWLAAVPAGAQPRRPMSPEMRPRMPGMEQAPAEPATQPPVPWINVHVHLVGGRGAQQDFAGAVYVAVREMDRFGVAMTILMPPPQVDAQATHDADDFVGALGSYRSRFAYLAGGGVLNPVIHRHADPASVTDAVKRSFAAAAERLIYGGAAGFGEMASLHTSHAAEHPYEFVPADHPLFRVLADVAARRDVPIDLHMSMGASMIPLMKLVLVDAGLDPEEDVTFVAAGLGAGAAALLHQGKIDIIALWSGQYALMENAGFKLRTLPDVSPLEDMSFAVTFIPPSSPAGEDPAVTMRKGLHELHDALKYMRVDAARVKKWGATTREEVDSYGKLVVRAGLLDAKPGDAEEYFASRLVDKINDFNPSKIIEQAKSYKP